MKTIALAGVGVCGPVVTMIGAFASLIGVGGACVVILICRWLFK